MFPKVPGGEGILTSPEEAKKIAQKMGYPIMLKATAGGGGRGMRLVNKENELNDLYDVAYQEALNGFGNGDLYIEKFIQEPRHIEIQILADTMGNVIHFGERDCSIQRRHQKLIEESPSPAVDDKLRSKMGEAAIAGIKGD